MGARAGLPEESESKLIDMFSKICFNQHQMNVSIFILNNFLINSILTSIVTITCYFVLGICGATMNTILTKQKEQQ